MKLITMKMNLRIGQTEQILYYEIKINEKNSIGYPYFVIC